MTVPVSELQSIAPSAIIELFELQLNTAIQGSNTIYRFHAGTNATGTNGNIVWAGNVYQAFPVEADGFEYSGNGQLPRPKIRISNILGTISTIILLTPLEGAKVTRIRTMARFLDAVNFAGGVNPFGTPDPTASFPAEIFYIDRKSAETRDVVEYELAAAFDLIGVRAPKRQCISNICQWVYRSSECGYTEASYYDENDKGVSNSSLDVCGKKLSSCKARFGPIYSTASITAGSNAMTLNSTAGLSAGLPIYGFGVPNGTTISSITNSTALVMSAAATASTSVSVSGTPSVTDATMTVASATGLAPGQTVFGAYMPPGTTITNIAGTTLTLNQRPYLFGRGATWNYTWTLVGSFWQASQVIAIDTTGISVGMYVFGSNGINTTVATVGSGQITLNSYGTLTGPDRPRRFSTLDQSTTSVGIMLYFMPASPGSNTYSITASNQFIFRTKDGVLNFGSFPGVGTFFT